MSSNLAALQAERDVLQRSVLEKDAELSALRSQAQLQQGSLDLERERLARELEALRAQLQQQVQKHQSHTLHFTDGCWACGGCSLLSHISSWEIVSSDLQQMIGRTVF